MKIVAWLFSRFVIGRALSNPVRFLLLVVALFLATTLWSSVLRISRAGVESFGEALGISSAYFAVAVVPVGGRLPLEAVAGCLSVLPAGMEVVAVRRESGIISSAAQQLPRRLLGVAAYGSGIGGPREFPALLLNLPTARELQVVSGDTVTVRSGELVFKGQVEVDSGGSVAPLLPDAVTVPLALLSTNASAAVIDGLYLRRGDDAQVSQSEQDELRVFLGSCVGAQYALRVETATQRMERAENLLAAYRFNVLVMAAMTLLVCAVLVCQSMSLSLIAVSRELSILRTLGVGSGVCLLLTMGEGVVAAVVAAALGISVGYPVTLSFTQLFLGTIGDIYNMALLEPTTADQLKSAVGVFFSIVLVGLVSSAIGSIGALRVSASVGTRKESLFVRPWSAKLVLWAALGSGVALAGAAGYLMAWPSLLAAYLFIAVVLCGAAGVAPAALWIFGRMAVWRVAPAAGRLAQGAVAHGGRRYVWGAVGASLALTLMVALSLMVESFRSTLERWALVRLQGDLFVSSALSGQSYETRIPETLVHRISEVKGVAAVIPYYEIALVVDGVPVQLAATDLLAQIRRQAYVIVQGNAHSSGFHHVPPDAVLITEGAARTLQLAVGDRVVVGSAPLRVHAIVQEFGTEMPLLIVDQSRFLALYPGHGSKSVTIDLTDRSRAEVMHRELERIVGGTMLVRDQQGLLQVVRSLFNRTFRVTESVTWIVFVIAVLGLATSTLQYMWERRAEVKTLLVLGAARSLVVRAAFLEAALVSVAVLAIGVCAGILLGWCLTCYINPLSFGWTLTYTVSWQCGVLGVAFLVAVLSVIGLCAVVVVRFIGRLAALSSE